MMMKKGYETPTLCEDGHYRHPAYGQISLTTERGHIGALYGTDLNHSSAVLITISRSKLDQSNGADYRYEDGAIMRFNMSRSQFAQFITSSGEGGGTPITLEYAPPKSAGVERVPRIAPIESKAAVLRREIEDSAKRDIEKIRKDVDALKTLIDSGKVGIKDARAIVKSLQCHVENLPTNLQYSVQRGEEALAKATHAAKMEIEGYASQTVKRLGMESIKQLMLGNDSNN